MRSHYKRIGDYVTQIKLKNTDDSISSLKGININKHFMPSVANINGTDLSKYRVVKKNQFAFNPMHVGRDEVLPISMLEDDEPIIVSPAYVVFEVKDEEELLPAYLMMWCRRSEFDRNAWFMTDNSVRGGFSWADFCDMELPVPSIEKQREIVREYNVVNDRILLNEQLMNRLEKSTFALFEEFFPIHGHDIETEHTTLEQLVSFNPKHTIKKNSATTYVEMANVAENSMTIGNPIVRPFTAGSKFKNNDTLLARITPCLENGKTAFINVLGEDEIAYGSTEFIVMRSKGEISPFWIYCLAKNENFRSYAISSMVGSSGRQRVHSDYLKEYRVDTNGLEAMSDFHRLAAPMFKYIANKHQENHKLQKLRELLLQKVA
ncbi:restriction endonuclease subunit S [Vibrio parahaemolyticus]|nr:restriction endonuclease subunit S [Vibrio parahaemolyticus]HCG8550408.1 restriction endonuclease subunit S [Vibrio parahaemolyticus]HCH0771069.1 restriction endonuclease subunit S [Vibrio parahaemolyticus]HCH0773380.1 restriction endonuclease subunit S [Vibrio parahaemolyticus]HCH1006222.1 restriction endonuclease subunit S [Vibrio parahaemolyticus]